MPANSFNEPLVAFSFAGAFNCSKRQYNVVYYRSDSNKYRNMRLRSFSEPDAVPEAKYYKSSN